jgi:hypothetical protein
MRIFDSGLFQVDGSLSPGREESGFLRVVQSPFIFAAGHVVEPRTLSDRGVRTYNETFQVPKDATVGPFDLVAPDVRGADLLPPLRFWGLRRVGTDTLTALRGGDIVVAVDTIPEASQPVARSRQWFAEVRTATGSFRLSADGAPPRVLRIPAEWIPLAPDGRVDISLIYYQSALVRSADLTYTANVLLDTRLNWVVRLQDAP